jgi:hypothetical protein
MHGIMHACPILMMVADAHWQSYQQPANLADDVGSILPNSDEWMASLIPYVPERLLYQWQFMNAGAAAESNRDLYPSSCMKTCMITFLPYSTYIFLGADDKDKKRHAGYNPSHGITVVCSCHDIHGPG